MFILHILPHIVAYSFEAVVFQRVCVCVFIVSVFGNGKCHAIFWLAPSVTFSVCYSNIWGEFWDLSAVIINLYWVYLEVKHLSCPPLQKAKYSSLLDFITIFWYQLPCLFFSHKCLLFFGLVDQTLHLGCTQCVELCMILISGFSLPQHWFLSSFCRNNRSKPRGKEEVELPCAGPYFGNALTLVLYPARNGPLNFACVIWGASCKTNVSNFTNLTTGSFHLLRFHKFEKFIMLGKQSWILGPGQGL